MLLILRGCADCHTGIMSATLRNSAFLRQCFLTDFFFVLFFNSIKISENQHWNVKGTRYAGFLVSLKNFKNLRTLLLWSKYSVLKLFSISSAWQPNRYVLKNLVSSNMFFQNTFTCFVKLCIFIATWREFWASCFSDTWNSGSWNTSYLIG